MTALLHVLRRLFGLEEPLTLREEIERENLAKLRRHAIFAPPPHAHDGRLEEPVLR